MSDASFNPYAFDDNGTAQAKLAFLVSGSIEISKYMVDEIETHKHTHIVYALNADEAKSKFEQYYEKQTEEYSIYYNVHSVIVFDTIY